MKTLHRVCLHTPGLRGRAEFGFTLVEMMIAMTIGLGIVAALVAVLATSSSSTRSNDRTSELMANGRHALNTMKQELRQAGFRGYTWAEPLAAAALGTLGNECLEAGASAGSFVSNIRQGVWGASKVNPFANSCIPPASYAPDNDVLVVRRVASTASTTLNAGTVYFQSSYSSGQVFRGGTAPGFADNPTPVATFAVQVYVYYISPFTLSANENPRVPALYRVALQSDGNMSRELVASGVERLKVQYGKLSQGAAPTLQFFDALSGNSSSSAVSDWDSVHAVRIWLLVRNETPEPGYVHSQSYTLGSQTYDYSSAPDSYRRQLFSSVVQLRN